MKFIKRNISSDYIKEKTVKDLVVLHFTAGGTLVGAETELAKPDHINVPHIMDRDGQVYEYFNPKDGWAYYFKGMFATHGTERKHRAPGSIGSLCSNRGFGGGLAKGKKMAGHMGAVRVTNRNLDLVRIDEGKNLLLVKGTVPGANTGTIMVRPSIRLYTSKAKLAAGKK